MRAAQLRWSTNTWRYLPLALMVTAAVAVPPVVLVWELRSAGVIDAWWPALLLTGVLSLTIASGLRLVWARHRRPFDLLFSELLLWGWLSHWRTQRQLVSAMRLLRVFDSVAPVGALDQALTPERHAQLLRRLAEALDAQDMYLDGHSRRVARHATMVGRRMGLSRQDVAKLRAAAAIHDVGKLHVPVEILAKPAKLTDEEFAIVRRHPEDGAAMVANMGDPDLVAIVMHHHERVDGGGYPAGLAGDQIPLGARIVAVADTFDAITSPRAYRPAGGHREAMEELRRCAGTQLDANAVKAFLSCYSGWRQVLLWAALVALPNRAIFRAWARGGAPVTNASNNVLATVAVTAAIGATLTAGGPASPLAQGRASRPDQAVAATSAYPPSGAVADQSSHVSRAHFAWHHSARPSIGADHHAVTRPHTPRLRAPGASRHVRRTDSVHRTPGHRHFSKPVSAPSSPAGAGAPSGSIGGAQGSGSAAPVMTSAGGAAGSAHHKKWVAPGHSAVPPPGLEPAGPPGVTGKTPGQSGSAPPGLRGQTPPGRSGH